MAKPRGHRANKPNDSFGTINNDSLYRGKHREDVYKDDDEDNEAEETVEAQEADTNEATPQQADSFVEQKQEPEHDYKKRYDDLKRHYDTKVNEFKGEINELRQSLERREVEMPNNVAMPKTMEELEEFKAQYPEVFDVVQTVSSLQTESQVSQLREELGTIKEREKDLEKKNAYQQLRANKERYFYGFPQGKPKADKYLGLYERLGIKRKKGGFNLRMIFHTGYRSRPIGRLFPATEIAKAYARRRLPFEFSIQIRKAMRTAR